MNRPGGESLAHIGFVGRAAARPRHVPSRPAAAARLLPPLHPAPGPVDSFIAWVLESAGLPAAAYRAAPLQRRLASCLRALQVDSVAGARRRLTDRPDLLAPAVGALLIGVTEFFRDADEFDALRRVIGAELAPRPGPIRIWSAACANGAELISLAMLLAEEGLLDRSHLLGTDCRIDAIQEAQCGLYRQAAAQAVPAALRRKYLRQAGAQWHVADDLRRVVRWRVRDLLAGPEEGPWDIILWRNMSIYLEAPSAAAVWASLVSTLRPGGLLVVGRAERAPAAAGLTPLSRCIYRLPEPGHARLAAAASPRPTALVGAGDNARLYPARFCADYEPRLNGRGLSELENTSGRAL